MGSKQSKGKPKAAAKARGKKVKVTDLAVAQGAAVKGGDTKTTTKTTSTKEPYLVVTIEDAPISSYK